MKKTLIRIISQQTEERIIPMVHIRKLTKADFEEIYALSEFAFQYQLSKEEREKKQKEASIHEIWGWIEEGNLAAKLHIIPLECYIGGRKFKMGGVNAVATWPEYRRKGMVKHLLHHALQEMKRNNQTVSFLHPFSFGFYRKYGWELAFTNKEYSIPMNILKEVDWRAGGYVKRIQEEHSFLQSIYEKYAIRYNGTLVRNEHWWKYRVLKDEFQLAASFSDTGVANGYLIYQVKNDTFFVKEIAYHSMEAQRTLFQFISNHDSMADKVELTVPENDLLYLFMETPSFKQEIKPYFMARIVDVESFLSSYPFDYSNWKTFSIAVEDRFMKENEGIYRISSEKGVQKMRKEDSEQKISCSIQVLSMVLLGYKRPEELAGLGLLKGDKQAIISLEKAVPIRQTFLPDFF